MRILVVEDDSNLAPFLVKALEEASYVADLAGTLKAARQALADARYEMVSLDLQLPDGSGLDLLAEIRGSGHSMPVLVLSSLASVADRVAGLDRGADDYLAKPFALAEYLSRVRSILRRAAGGGDAALRLGAVVCDEAAHRVTCAGKPVDLTPKEFALLRLLLRAPGSVLSRSQIVNAVWKWTFDGYSNVVDVHVSSLRRKLKGGGVQFRAVPKVGYAIEEESGGPPGREA